jgi:hypothetical protein
VEEVWGAVRDAVVDANSSDHLSPCAAPLLQILRGSSPDEDLPDVSPLSAVP